MGAIAINIPQISGEQEIEVEVRINGEKNPTITESKYSTGRTAKTQVTTE
ncbi:MAG: hypothetical protein ACI9Z3_001573 [Roseivirga sp.]|jgi:hypothetical protein